MRQTADSTDTRRYESKEIFDYLLGYRAQLLMLHHVTLSHIITSCDDFPNLETQARPHRTWAARFLVSHRQVDFRAEVARPREKSAADGRSNGDHVWTALHLACTDLDAEFRTKQRPL